MTRDWVMIMQRKLTVYLLVIIGLIVTAAVFMAFQERMLVALLVTSLLLAFALKEKIGSWKRRRRKPYKVPERKDALGKCLAIDCEMVGVGPNGKRSALARVSIVDWNLDLVFDTYVQVMDRVTDYRTHVSGIRKKDLKGAMNFKQCRAIVEELLQGNILVGHGLENDFDALRYIHPEEMIRDTSQYKPLQKYENGRWKPRKLRDLVRQYLGNEDFQQGEHDSIHDARAVMELYHIFHREWDDQLIAKIK